MADVPGHVRRANVSPTTATGAVSHTVVVGERASLEEPNAHRCEVFGRDRLQVRPRIALRFVEFLAFALPGRVEADRSFQRATGDAGNRLDQRQCTDRINDARIELVLFRSVRCLHRRRVDLDGDESGRHKSDVETIEPGNASIQERRAGQDENSDRDLRDDKEAARPPVVPIHSGGAATIAKSLLEARTAQRQQRQQRAHVGYERADAHSVDERTCADGRLFDSRKILWNDGQAQRQRGMRGGKGGETSDGGQRRPFAHQLERNCGR